MTGPIPLSEHIATAASTKAGTVIAAIFVAGLAAAAFASVCTAHTGPGGDDVESLSSAATVERSGSLAVYPLLY